MSYYNKNKKIHSVKITYYYEFDWSIENQVEIFKTIQEFERWELRNPECVVEKVKVRYYKNK